MKKNQLLVLLFIIPFLNSCQKRDRIEEYSEDGLIVKGVKVNGKFEGEVKYFGKSGVLINTSNFAGGILNGRSVIFYSSGKKYQDQFFVNGKMHGFLSVFDTTGQLRFRQFYFYGNPCGAEFNYVNGNLTSYSFTNFEHELLFSSEFNSKGQLFVYKTHKEMIFYSVIAEGDTVKKYWVNLLTPNPPKMDFSYSYIVKNKLDSIIYKKEIATSDFYSKFNIQPDDPTIRQYIGVEYFDLEEKKRKIWAQSEIFGR